MKHRILLSIFVLLLVALLSDPAEASLVYEIERNIQINLSSDILVEDYLYSNHQIDVDLVPYFTYNANINTNTYNFAEPPTPDTWDYAVMHYNKYWAIYWNQNDPGDQPGDNFLLLGDPLEGKVLVTYEKNINSIDWYTLANVAQVPIPPTLLLLGSALICLLGVRKRRKDA